MTRAEFDAWVEQHYGELLAVAKRRTACEPEDVVQTAVVAMLSRSELARRTPATMWPWAVEVVRESAAHARRTAQRQGALTAEAKNIARAGLLHGCKRTNPDPGRLWEETR